MRTISRSLAIMGVMALLLTSASHRLLAAATDGIATFRVTTVTANAQYAPRHVLAIWVADANTNFVKTLMRYAGTRQQYLSRWNTARAGWTAVDGSTGATLTSHGTRTVTWNGRLTNNVIAPDGRYFFVVEFTERNGTGPFTGYVIPFDKGPNNTNFTPATLSNFSSMQVTYTVSGLPHDVAVAAISPTYLPPATNVALTVLVTNQTASAETFSLTLENQTLGVLVGEVQNLALAGNTATNLVFPWSTVGAELGAYRFQATAVLGTNDNNLVDNVLDSTITIRPPTHDVDLDIAFAPVMIAPNATSNVVVSIANAGDFTETFPVVLVDETASRVIYSNQVVGLPPQGLTNLTIAWNALNAAIGYHTLRATAGPIAGELDAYLEDNTHTVSVAVASGTTTVTLVATNQLWRYEDTGRDFSPVPWTELNYFDGDWKSGLSPLGYADATYLPNFATVIGYGPSSSAKYLTAYFRSTFYLNAPPLSLNFRIMRDDGFVLYFNGQEVLRNNMNAGTVRLTTPANTTVGNTESYVYTEMALPASALALLKPGLNQVAIEVHQVNATSSDLSMSMRLTAVVPNLPVVHDVAVLALEAGSALAGETLPVSLVVTNQGTVAETFTVYLVNATNNAVLASQTIANLAAGAAQVVPLQWHTTSMSGDVPLKAFTVMGTTTNLAGALTGGSQILAPTALPQTAGPSGGVGGRSSVVLVSGSYLLAGAGAVLEVWDAANPAALALLGSVRLPGMIEGLAVSGAHVFAACGPAGVQVVNMENPALPRWAANIETAGHAYNVRIENNNLFLAAGSAGLKMYDISNPTSPALRGTYHGEGPIRDVYSSGNTVHVLDGHFGLQIMYAANPANPTRQGSVKFDGGVDMAVAGTKAYVLDAGGRLRIINLFPLITPTNVYTAQLPGVFTRGLAVAGTMAYVAAENGGVLTVNVAAAPQVVATNTAADAIYSVAVSGATLYAADGYAGLKTYSLANPAAPQLNGTYANGGRAADVVMRDGLAYVAAGEAGLVIYDIANPIAPRRLGAVAGINNARSVALAGTLACVGEGPGGFKVVEVANPAQPALLGGYSSTNIGAVRAVACDASRAVMTDGARLYLFSLATPATPQLLATASVSGMGMDLALAGNTAWLAAGSGGVQTYDLSGGALSPAGTAATPGFASAISLAGLRAYVAAGTAGWLVLDAANPSSPGLLATHSGQGPVRQLGHEGSTVQLAAGGGPAQILDVTNPLTPVPQKAIGPLISALKLSGSSNLVAVAEDAAGLALLEVGVGADANRNGMPDDWEQQIVAASLAAGGPIGSLYEVRAEDDYDGDGLSNRQEFIAGTSPVDAASVFAVQAPAADAAGKPSLVRWHSAPGKTYTLYQSTNLSEGFTVLQDNIAATPPLNTFTNPAAGTAVFYLLSVR